MEIVRTIKSWWSSLLPDPRMLDHVPVERKRRQDWRTAAVKKAAERHGKPLKTGPDGVPREVFIGGTFQVVGVEKANVVRMRRAK